MGWGCTDVVAACVAAPTATWASLGQQGKEAKQPQHQPLAAPSPWMPLASLQPHAHISHRHANPHPSPLHPHRTRAAPNPHLPSQLCRTLNLLQTPALCSLEVERGKRQSWATHPPLCETPRVPCTLRSPPDPAHPCANPRSLHPAHPSAPALPSIFALPPPGSPRIPPHSPFGRQWRCRRGAPPSGGGGGDAGCKAAARAGGAHSGAGGGGCGRCGRPIPARERGRGTPWPLHGAGGWAGGQSAGGEGPRGFERFLRSPSGVLPAVHPSVPPRRGQRPDPRAGGSRRFRERGAGAGGSRRRLGAALRPPRP